MTIWRRPSRFASAAAATRRAVRRNFECFRACSCHRRASCVAAAGMGGRLGTARARRRACGRGGGMRRGCRPTVEHRDDGPKDAVSRVRPVSPGANNVRRVEEGCRAPWRAGQCHLTQAQRNASGDQHPARRPQKYLTPVSAVRRRTHAGDLTSSRRYASGDAWRRGVCMMTPASTRRPSVPLRDQSCPIPIPRPFHAPRWATLHAISCPWLVTRGSTSPVPAA